MTDKVFQEILGGYIECAAWAEECHDVTKDFRKRAEKDVKAFVDSVPAELLGQAIDEQDASRVGHDFWMTRQGHGVGFWDGDYTKELGDKLTKLSKAQGEVYCEKFRNKLRLI